MAEPRRFEVTNRELIVFFFSVMLGLFIFAGGSAGWFDPLTAGVIVLTVVGFFFMGLWFESKGIFGSGMTVVWIVFSLSVVAILSGLISRGYIPFAFYSSAAAYPALVISNAMLYGLLIVLAVALIVAVYIVKKKPEILSFR